MDDLAPGLVVSADGPVRLIELNRPEQRNAASEALHTALAVVWDRLAADDRVRAVVLTGRGRAFSAGGDFRVMTRVARDEAFREQNVAEARSIITGMVRFPAPVIAAVNGPAVGLGCSLALLSDLVLMAEGSYLADPHLSVGLVPGDGGPVVLPLIVGPARPGRCCSSASGWAQTKRSGSAWRTGSCRPTNCGTRRWTWPAGWPRCRSRRCGRQSGR